MPTVSSDVVWHDLEGELVLLNTATGRYHGLNAVGGYIFRAVAAGQPVDEIAASLSQRYRVDASVAADEVRRLIGELQAARLLTAAAEPAPSTPSPPASST